MIRKKRKSVLIMGAGLAGLAAGFELAKAKWQVTVIEQCSRVGGMARTIDVNGFSFDTGPHRWYTKNSAIDRWMLKLLGKETIKVPRLTRIYFDKKYFYYPIRLSNALKGIGLGKTFLAVIDYFKARISARLFPRRLYTMEDGYVNQFGRTLYEIFFKRYSEKLWGVDCRKISVDWVGQRTRGLNISTIIRETFFKSRSVVSLVDEFSYPKKGVGRIAEKMADFIKKSGGNIVLNAEVQSVNMKGNKICSVRVVRNGKAVDYRADFFISSIPLNDLIFRMSPKADTGIRKTAGKLTYRDELQVALFVKKTHITPDTWIYVHPKEIPFMRVMEMDNWSNALSPKGTTTLVFEIACNIGDAIWKKTDREVISLVKKAYCEEFADIKGNDVIGGYVHRSPKEYPVYHLEYREDVSKIKDYLKKLSNLQVVGRNGTFRYNNMDHSVEMGVYAAWNLIEGKYTHDIDGVNIEREYLEEKKIENIEDETVEEKQ